MSRAKRKLARSSSSPAEEGAGVGYGADERRLERRLDTFSSTGLDADGREAAVADGAARWGWTASSSSDRSLSSAAEEPSSL